LKKAYNAKWNYWFLTGEKTFTRFGNRKSPGYANCVSWLSEIWKDFSSAQIRKSFDQCGITSQYDLHSSLNHILKTKTTISEKEWKQLNA
jgi:hypothetical protein